MTYRVGLKVLSSPHKPAHASPCDETFASVAEDDPRRRRVTNSGLFSRLVFASLTSSFCRRRVLGWTDSFALSASTRVHIPHFFKSVSVSKRTRLPHMYSADI
ncbi:hypothetical protein CHARACLAT_017694 [Characodon lateralis]|uniref:Uncharacterized protein n=1 Tax=Characodon lateralis TaxID=208331 RepID=A0ABU7DJZ1_9TELE|nr:hypothetical protein [Characodon lateralis]